MNRIYTLCAVVIILVLLKWNSLLRRYLPFYFQQYLEQTKNDWNYMTPTDFNEIGARGRNQRYFILDVRKPEDYAKGYISGSTNIFWLELMKGSNLQKLPRDKEIIVVCYVGHTASQILVMLKMLGYRAKVLKFGMGISPDPLVPIAGWSSLEYPITKSN